MINIAKFLPREDKFLRLIGDLGVEAFKSAKHLGDYVANPADKSALTCIEQSKSRAKEISAKMTQDLCRTFVTPFDREDIQNFSTNLYRIPKTIEKASEHLKLFPEIDPRVLKPQVDLILQEAEAMDLMVTALVKNENMREVTLKAQQVDEMETKGDLILQSLLADLMRNTEDARELIIRKDIYDILERVIDRYRDTASVALQIVLKHS